MLLGMQEVKMVLFLATCVPHLKGQWQVATLGPSQGPGPGTLGGPLAMRQACCVFLEFAALAVGQDHQPPCCPPVSPYEKVCNIQITVCAHIVLCYMQLLCSASGDALPS